MIKLFDYKFLITLGLSLVVYFLYREVDMLNKRVSTLEKNNRSDKSDTNKPKKQLIELPPPPVEELTNTNEKMVEEYSNEEIEHYNIYSHDNLETNTNDHDSLMVDSILNMVKHESKSNTEQTVPSEHSAQLVHSSQSEHSSHSEHLVQSEHSSHSEHSTQSENVENVDNIDLEKSEEIQLVKHKNTTLSLDALNKKKLDELQELATKYGIDINNENGKKKKKVDLAQDIFNKQ